MSFLGAPSALEAVPEDYHFLISGALLLVLGCGKGDGVRSGTVLVREDYHQISAFVELRELFRQVFQRRLVGHRALTGCYNYKHLVFLYLLHQIYNAVPFGHRDIFGSQALVSCRDVTVYELQTFHPAMKDDARLQGSGNA